MADEQHLCKVVPQTNNFVSLVCVGDGELGSIYALYAFSHQILRIHPQAFWVEKQTEYAGFMSIDDSFSWDSGAPEWKFRGFFINDEDQLGGWAQDPMGEKVFNLQMWDMVFQTILRLRGNAVIVGTSAYPDEDSFRLAARRGLYIAEHHITLLGVNIFNWPDGLPYDYPYNPEVVENVWRKSAEYQKDRKMLWTLGYRGKNDYPFWYDVPSFNTSESRGKLVAEAVATQKSILTEIVGTSKPLPMFSYLWDELLPLYAGGYLKFPEGVTVVHADTGAGNIFNKSLVREGHGLYYHVAMESGKQNQLTELIGPRRFFKELIDFVLKKATSYFILNTSDLRAVPLTTKMAMDYVWNSSFFTKNAPVDSEFGFIEEWVTQTYDLYGNFGLITQVTQTYVDYFMVDYMAGVNPTIPVGEQHLSHQTRDLARNITGWFTGGRRGGLDTHTATQQLGMLANPLKQLQLLLSQAEALLPKIPPSRQQFFANHLITQTKFHLYGASALNNTANALISLARGQSIVTAQEYVNVAMSSIDSFLSAERDAEQGQFKNWFMWDQLDDWFNLRDVMRNCTLALQSMPLSNFPHGRQWTFGTGIWSREFQYEFDRPSYFPMFHDSPYRLTSAVLVLCARNSASCSLSPIGIFLNDNSTSVSLSWNSASGSVVYYTIDGSTPSLSSPMWTGKPIEITSAWVQKFSTATIQAQIWDGTKFLAPLTRAVVTYQATATGKVGQRVF